MRILLVSTLYYPNLVGGAERAAQKLAEALAERGHEVAVACLGKSAQVQQDSINGVRVHYLPVRNLYWPFGDRKPGPMTRALWHALDTYNPLMASQVGDLIQREQPDVINTHNIAGFSVAVWAQAKRLGVPVVHTLGDQYLLCPNTTMFKHGRNCATPCLSCRTYSWPRKRYTKLVDVVTGHSQFVIDRHLQAGCFRGVPARVIYNACPSLAEPRTFEARPGPMRFGFLGRLDPTKGIEVLLKAFLNLPAGTAELWIAGKGSSAYERRLKAMTERRGNIKWLGYVPPASLLSNVEVLVVPALWNDTAPLVVQEAAAHGLPVLGANRGGIPELVGEGCGWTFEPSELSSLETAIVGCLESRNALQAMGERAREWSSRFSAESAVRGYLGAYEVV